MKHNMTWRRINYPFITMNPVERYVRIRFLRFVIAWIKFDIAIARSSGNLRLVQAYSRDLHDRLSELERVELG